MSDSNPEQYFDPTDPYARTTQIFPKLKEEEIERIKPYGKIQSIPQGTFLFERGQRDVGFYVVLKGEIEILEYSIDGTPLVTVHEEKEFTGDVDLFNDREVLVSGRMGSGGEVLWLDRLQFHKMLAAESDIMETVMKAFILRRMGLISRKQGSVSIITSKVSGDTLRIERFLERNGYPLRILDFKEDSVKRLLGKPENYENNLPVVLLHNKKEALKNPSNLELARALGIVEPIHEDHVYDVTIIGAGPAGLSAAVYAASEGLSTLVVEAEAPGGQAGTSSKIENYLGFPLGVSGQELAGRAQVQAHKFGATIALPFYARSIDCSNKIYKVHLEDQYSVSTRTIIIASGATYRKLNLENESKFDGNGIYYAATIMEGDLCKYEEVVVIGGGNSAGQAAMFLSGYAKHVHVLVRGEGLSSSMSEYLVGRIHATDNITVHPYTEVVALHGDRSLRKVVWRNKITGETETHAIRRLFLMIGAIPNTSFLDKCIELDKKGFVLTGQDISHSSPAKLERPALMLETSCPGVFAVGDVRSGSVKRVASAVGEGAMAISLLHQVLSEMVPMK